MYILDDKNLQGYILYFTQINYAYGTVIIMECPTKETVH